MKRRRIDPLLLVIALTALVVAGFGCYVKTQIFQPLELHTDADPIACAFLFPETESKHRQGLLHPHRPWSCIFSSNVLFLTFSISPFPRIRKLWHKW